MKTNYSRRDAITVGALALIGTTLAGRTKAETSTQTPATATKSDPGAIKTWTASCNCGQLRVTCKGPDPERRSICFCKLCQKQTGSAFSIQARFPKEQVTVEGKSTAWKFPIEGAAQVTYRNCLSGGGTSHFCPVCGSTVWYTIDNDDARIGVKVGAFADPAFPAPNISGFEEYRFPWAMNVSALPMPGGHHQ